MTSAVKLLTQDDDTREDLAKLSVEELKAGFLKSVGWTVQGVLRSAEYICEMERRGIDVRSIRDGYEGLINNLRKVACGQMAPELLVNYGSRPLLISKIGGLPLADQQEIINGKSIEIVAVSPDGRRTMESRPVGIMTPEQVRLVFAVDHIRTVEEQNAVLSGQRLRASMPLPESVGSAKIDRERNGVMAKRGFYSLADLETMVSILRK